MKALKIIGIVIVLLLLVAITLPFLIFRKIMRLAPDLLIVGTHELLVVAVLYKIFSRKKIVYDVQENYLLNITHTDAFPLLLRWPIAMWVRLKEIALAGFFDRFLPKCTRASRSNARLASCSSPFMPPDSESPNLRISHGNVSPCTTKVATIKQNAR